MKFKIKNKDTKKLKTKLNGTDLKVVSFKIDVSVEKIKSILDGKLNELGDIQKVVSHLGSKVSDEVKIKQKYTLNGQVF